MTRHHTHHITGRRHRVEPDLVEPELVGADVVELVRADVAAGLGSPLGDVPGGGAATWALWTSTRRLAVTDEPMTDEQAAGWAARLLGEQAVFRCGRLGGGYWLTAPCADGGRS